MKIDNNDQCDKFPTKIRRLRSRSLRTFEKSIAAQRDFHLHRSWDNKSDHFRRGSWLASFQNTSCLYNYLFQCCIVNCLICFAALALSGCATINGDRVATQPLRFDWQRQGERIGSVRTVAKDGKIFTGRYYEITRKTRLSEIHDLRFFWGIYARGRDLPAWGNWNDGIELMMRYDGKVLAILRGPSTKMRCSFTLIRPSLGIDGGGNGWCQISGGGSVPAMLPPKS